MLKKLIAALSLALMASSASANDGQGGASFDPSKYSYADPYEAQRYSLELIDALTDFFDVDFYRALATYGEYSEQAARDEERLGLNYAHAKAAYEFGYAIGDSELLFRLRTYSEALQIAAISRGDREQDRGEDKSGATKFFESVVGTNGTDYTVNETYLLDAGQDVKNTVAGAFSAENGRPADFEAYAEQNGIELGK